MTESIIFAGTPENAAETLRSLVTSGIEVEFVLTRPDAEIGRKRILTPSPVAVAASELGIQTIKTDRIDEDTVSRLRNSSSQLAIIVAYGVLLKSEAIDSLTKGWFNLHYSMLPMLRGAAPVQYALLNGLRETGVTLFKIDEGLDTGAIVAQVPALIEPYETAGSLLSRLTRLGTTLILQELPKIFSGVGLSLTAQSGQPTFAPKLDRQVARIRFDETAENELCRIMATNPEPGAWCLLDGEPFKILDARSEQALSPGLGELVLLDGRVICGFREGTALQIVTVQPSGKQPMSAVDWIRGRKTKVQFE